MLNYLKKHWSGLLISILIPIFVGLLSSLLSGNVKAMYSSFEKPLLSPPDWLFGVVWPILYVMMGIAAYLVCDSLSGKSARNDALMYYVAQLTVNFLWSIVFFRFGWLWGAVLVIVALDYLVIRTIKVFAQSNKTAAFLLVPYLIWILFATYLNIGIAILN